MKEIYKKYSGRNNGVGAVKFMSLSEFTDLITDVNVYNDDFGQKQVASQFNLAMMTQLEELENDKFLNMSFVEFLEALVRVAENLQIPHLIDVSNALCLFFKDAELLQTEIQPEVRKSWGSRLLEYKIESLCIMLCQRNLGPKGYERYLKEL